MSDLDQFCILARSQKGRACAALIQQAINNKKIFVFGELLDIPSVSMLKDDDEFKRHFNTLELFAYGTYSDYIRNLDNYIELGDFAIRKLKYLTVVTLAEKNKVLTYENLNQVLHINDQRLLEDLLIEAIYLNLVKGKLNQKLQIFRVLDVFGRDVKRSSLPDIINKLKKWKNHCERARSILSNNISALQSNREQDNREQEEFDIKVAEIKKSLKSDIDGDEMY